MPSCSRTAVVPDVARAAPWLPLVCFLSGAAGLIFETVWFHRSGLVFGSSIWSTTLVLSSFMGGLTVGSAIVGRRAPDARGLLSTYAAVEAIVAVSGVALTHALPGLTHIVVALTGPRLEDPWMTNVIRFATAFAILLVPSSAMGASLPLLVGALARARARPGFGSALGRAYGWNTLGAVVGVVGAEVWLIAAVGVAGSAWCAGALSLTAAAIAMARPEPSPSLAGEGFPPPTAPNRSTAGSSARDRVHVRLVPLLASSFLSGAVLLALEVIWFRFLTLFVLSTTLAASVMLATVLAGIAMGGMIGAAWLARAPEAIGGLPAVALAGGIAVAASYTAFQALTSGTQVGAWQQTMWFAGVLTLPASLMSGVIFTLTGAAVQRAVFVDTRAAGWLSVANTAGGMCGPLIAAFVMLPALGTERAFAVLAAMYLGVGVLTLAGVGSWRAHVRSALVLATGVAFIAALAAFPFGLMRDVYFARVARPYESDGSQIVATREGPSETIFLTQQDWLGEPVYTRLVTNGFSMSGTSIPALRYMRYFAYWPAALHRGPVKRVLVVCFGVGVTVGAALDLPSVESLDVAEISADIIAASDIIYPTGHPLHDPRVRLHVEDGRQFLESTAGRFDLITGEPPPPRTPGAVNIYTREYFQLIRARLADGGITTYWLPVGRPDPGTNVSSIVRAFCDVFDDCSLWNATPFDLMLVGTRGATGPVPEEEFVKPWTLPALRARLSEIGLELPQQLGATFLGDAEYLRELTTGSPPLDDDHPQRLRPVPGRPSLSDPGYGVDQTVTRLYRSVTDHARAREAFRRSPFIRRLWPERVFDATLPYFEHQDTLNQVLWEGGRPLQRIESVHRLLTETPLRTLPLWLMGSDDIKATIAARRDDGSGGPVYARGLTALAARDYGGAAAAFGEAEARGLRGAALRPLRVYAECMAGQLEVAKALAAGERPQSADERHFWEWLNRRFGVSPTALAEQ